MHQVSVYFAYFEADPESFDLGLPHELYIIEHEACEHIVGGSQEIKEPGIVVVSNATGYLNSLLEQCLVPLTIRLYVPNFFEQLL